MVMTWSQPAAQIELRCGIEWDWACGFECTTTIPAPKEIQLSAYLKYLFVYDEYIDNMEMYEMFTLERGLDIPERKTGPKYPYDQLELGDSFYLEGGDLSKLCNANYREWRRTGKKFTARKVENGVRVWRIE